VKFKIATILKLECKKRGINLTDLSKITKIGRTTLQDWTTGTQPKVEHLKKISDYLGLSIHYLLFGIEDPQTNVSKNQIELEDVFSGDLRVTIQRIKRSNGK